MLGTADILLRSMSAPAAGKFQDHYAILGVDPKANSEAIQAAYARLAQKYHKDNPETGNKDKFEAVNLAYEVLCDATLRAEFDKIKGIDQDEDKPQFGGAAFFDNLGRQNGLRLALLSILYERRQKKPYRPSLSMRHLDGMLNVTNDELNFALWYLKQRGLVQSDDKSNLHISVEGMEFLETTKPDPELVLPYLKAAAIAPQPVKPAPAVKAVPRPEERESVAKVLTRALARR